jgi:hypothetical protein
VVATGTYTDARLRRLRAPARDAADLAQVLADPGIGGFTVTTVIDQPAQQIRLAVEDFLASRDTQDLLLVYLSCHGLLDDYRRLYFAATDTRKDRLGATGVESAWVLDLLEHCRARRQILVLDSCFSGAFAQGAKGEADLGLRDRFLSHGRGRVVLTASNATEYSFEGDPTDAVSPAGSVFTAALVRGLRTGEADTDHDGHISVDDAYAYVFDQVQAAGAAQTPQRWLYGAEGRILLARSPAGPADTPGPLSGSLPGSLRAGLDSPHPGIRIGAVAELGEWLASGDPARVATARRHLQEVAYTDIPRVAAAARTLLGTRTAAEPPAPAVPSAADPVSPSAQAPVPQSHPASTSSKFVTFILKGEIGPEQVEGILETYGRVNHDKSPTWTYGGKQASWRLRTDRIWMMFVQLERGLIDGRLTWRLILSQRVESTRGVVPDVDEEERQSIAVIDRIQADLTERGYEPQRYEGDGDHDTPGERWGYAQAWEGN